MSAVPKNIRHPLCKACPHRQNEISHSAARRIFENAADSDIFRSLDPEMAALAWFEGPDADAVRENVPYRAVRATFLSRRGKGAVGGR